MAKYSDGICPNCGAEIEYEGSYEHDDSGATLQFRCPKCGVSGTVGYNLVFDAYHNVQDKDGNPIKLKNLDN